MSSPPADACLLIVDVQRQFINPHTAAILPGIQALLPAYHWVIASRILPCDNNPVLRWKNWAPLPASHPDSALAIDLSVRPAERTFITEKTGFGALTPTAHTWLKSKAVSEIHICGMDTDLCVLRSVYETLENGYRPIILSQLCASAAGQPLHHHALLQFKRMIGKAQIV